MKNTSLAKIAEKIRSCESILIFAHQNPDGDAIGSAVAAGLLCKQFGKQVTYTLKKDTKGCADLLPETERFGEMLLERYDLGIVIDCSSLNYIEGKSELDRCSEIVVLDHHITNERYGNYNYIDPAAAASGEIVYALIRTCRAEITEEIAHAVYVALVEDTGNFSFPNTTGKTHRIVAELYETCSDFDYYATELKKYEKEKLDLMCAFLNHLKYLHGTDMIIGVLRFDIISRYRQTDTDGLIDLIRNVKGCKVSVFIKESDPLDFKISMRSSEPTIDVSKISEHFGGGGHKLAAGFQYQGELSDLERYFSDYAERLWTDSY